MNAPVTTPGGTPLFRQEALDRLAVPEQLDRAITVAPPRSWVALAGLALVICAAIVWGIFGSVATRVPARGILVATGGQVTDAVAPASGVLMDTGLRTGDMVLAGQVIARLAQPEGERRLMDLRATAADLSADLARRTVVNAEAAASRQANQASRRAAAEAQIAAAEEREVQLADMLRAQDQLARGGLTTEERRQGLRERLGQARQSIADTRAQILAIDAEEIAARSASDRELAELAQRAADARRAADQQEVVLNESRVLVAPTDGRLLEWKAAFGTRIAQGSAVASIESGARGLEVVLYVQPDRGKQVQPGFAVRIEPGGFRKEEWGTLVGVVEAVSDFPVTRQGMIAVLQNEQLVDQFARRGAPFAVRVRLTPDPESATGYLWSGGRGPPGGLSSGMPAEGLIAVREQRPLALVLPFLRRISGS